MVTRPKPAYSRQGLAGSWGQDTDQGGTFLGILNHENQPGTLKTIKTDLEPWKTNLEPCKPIENWPEAM